VGESPKKIQNIKNREEEGEKISVKEVSIRKPTFSAIRKRGQESTGV